MVVVVVVNVRSSLSLSLVSFAAEKNVTGDLDRRDFFFLCLGF